jgi:hypothetical protein
VFSSKQVAESSLDMTGENFYFCDSLSSPKPISPLKIIVQNNCMNNSNLSLTPAVCRAHVSTDVMKKISQVLDSDIRTSLKCSSKLNPLSKPFVSKLILLGEPLVISKLNPLAESFVISKINPIPKPFVVAKESFSINPHTPSQSHIQLTHSHEDVRNDSLVTAFDYLDCTPRIINDVMTPNMSIISDTDKTLEPLKITDILISHEASIMVQDDSNIGSLLDPCAKPFSPRKKEGLRNSTQPAVVDQINVELLEPSMTTSTAPQKNTSIIQIENDMGPKEMMECLKTKHRERPIIAHLNINFLDPKFEPLKDMIKDNVDILLISETKLDESYPEGRFFIEGYKEPIRLDRNKNGGGLLFFIHDDLECKEIKSHKLPKKTEGIFLKLTIRNTKWLIMGVIIRKKKTLKIFSIT